MKKNTLKITALSLMASGLVCIAGFAPRLTTTIDASAQMTPAPLSMAQASDQDFAFDFTNLQTDFNTTNDSLSLIHI